VIVVLLFKSLKKEMDNKQYSAAAYCATDTSADGLATCISTSHSCLISLSDVLLAYTAKDNRLNDD